MTPEDLDDVMVRLERMWPMSKFRDLAEVETWREHLALHAHDAVTQVLAQFAMSGEYKRWRPDLPPILSALGVHGRAVSQSKRAGRGFRPLPPDVELDDKDLERDARSVPDLSAEAPTDHSLAAVRDLRARLRDRRPA
jgi:hypothetical protein